MSDHLTHIVEYLEDQLTGYTVGTNIFRGHMPDSPAACVTVYDAGGNTAPYGACFPWEEHMIEVRCRAASASAALALAQSVHAKLSFVSAVEMNSALNVEFSRAEGHPARFDRDQENRIIFLARYRMGVRRTDNY